MAVDCCRLLSVSEDMIMSGIDLQYLSWHKIYFPIFPLSFGK